MITKSSAIVLMIFTTFFTSLGQLLWKSGLGFESLFNLHFFLGFFSYGIGTILMLLAFKRGELTILYPIIATSYVWVSLLAPVFFQTDSMNLLKWIGVLVILVSVSFLGKSVQSSKGVHHV
jgi:uncharacterized membrane protein